MWKYFHLILERPINHGLNGPHVRGGCTTPLENIFYYKKTALPSGGSFFKCYLSSQINILSEKNRHEKVSFEIFHSFILRKCSYITECNGGSEKKARVNENSICSHFHKNASIDLKLHICR